MAGRFHDTAEWGAPFSWLRIGPADRWLPAASAGAPRDVVQMASTDYVLSPVGAPPPGVELSGPGFDAYFLGFGFAHGRGAVVLGTLGAFWESELSWNAADQVLMAGPVPITSPNIPTTLRLHFASPSGSTLVDVEATMPSGLVYRFSATPRI